MRLGMLLVVLLIWGCGYQNASHYARNVLGESVSTEVVISMEDPQNTVIIKDAVDQAVITKFRAKLLPKGEAKSHLIVSIGSVRFIPLQYDTNGYVITYRTKVNMRIQRITDGEKSTYSTSGNYDFSIEPNSIITDQARFEAISQGAQKGLDSFIAQVAAQGTIPPKDK